MSRARLHGLQLSAGSLSPPRAAPNARYVILPKDFEKGYKANVKKGDTEFAFYQ